MLLPDDPDVYAFTRRLGDVELLVLGNFSGRETVVDVEAIGPRWRRARLVLGNVPGREAPDDLVGCPPTLQPWEAVVLERIPSA